MDYRFYRSADKPNVFLGIRGRLSVPLVAGAAAGLLLGIIVGTATTGFLGLFSAVVFVAMVYFVLQIIQDRYSDKELGKWLVSKRFGSSFVGAPNRRIHRSVGSSVADGGGLWPVTLANMD